MKGKILFKVQGLVKRVLPFCLLTFLPLTASATEPQQFSPEKFQADMEQFITKEAQLTSEEVAKFFPLYREMQQKQRAVWNQMKDLGRNKPADEAAIKQAVQKRDELELEQRRIIQTYHNKFFKVLPASKVYDVIIAETKFHRAAIRNWRGHQANKKHQPQK